MMPLRTKEILEDNRENSGGEGVDPNTLRGSHRGSGKAVREGVSLRLRADGLAIVVQRYSGHALAYMDRGG